MATLVYDGRCSFCCRTVAWAQRRDGGRLTYATANGAREELMQRRLAQRAKATVLLLTRQKAYGESAAVVRVLWRLRQPWPVAGAVLWLVPRPLRDWGYRVVARNRRRL